MVNTSRLSVGGKSPLTGGIKESNVGGTVAFAMARLGISALVLEGKPAGDEYFILQIDETGTVELIKADDTKGMRTYALVEKLSSQYGEGKSITCIGPAGDSQLFSASIQSTDFDGRPCRAAGRGGLGAVMGSKGVKAIIISRKGKDGVEVKDPSSFKEAAMSFAKAVKEDEFSGKILPELGTACLVEPINAAGAFPTRNAREGQFEGAEKILHSIRPHNHGEDHGEAHLDAAGLESPPGAARDLRAPTDVERVLLARVAWPREFLGQFPEEPRGLARAPFAASLALAELVADSVLAD